MFNFILKVLFSLISVTFPLKKKHFFFEVLVLFFKMSFCCGPFLFYFFVFTGFVTMLFLFYVLVFWPEVCVI